MKIGDFNGDIKNTSLRLLLKNGNEIITSTCECGHCKNEFFVKGISDEYIPNFCPYCGIEFIRGIQDDN